MDWYLTVMKNYAGFGGRARRKEYWMFVLLYVVFGFLVGLAAQLVGEPLGSAFVVVFMLAHIIPSIAVAVRRLHDIDRSGWWLLIGLVPVIGGLVLLVLALLRGTAGPNRFGVAPMTPVE